MSTDLETAEKKIGELQSTCEVLSGTVAEQSATLERRGEVVTLLEIQRDDLSQKVDELTQSYERVKSQAMEAAMQNANDITPQTFAAALDTYALAVARLSTTDAHPQIVVALVQMAKHIRELETMADIIVWLNGAQ